MVFNPTRLTLARRRRGITKIRLAELAGVVSRSISMYESGSHAPPGGMIDALASALKVPPQFFTGPTLDEPPSEGASFRSLKSMTAGQKDAVLAAGALAYCLDDWISSRFTLPKANIPDVREFTPEDAAEYTRAHWRIGESSIRNMIHLLELHGVRVFSLAEDNAQVDAFSVWRNDTPYVFLNTMKSAEHSRFDAAHELGHLVMHRHASHNRDIEHEANRFASAFLMPKGSVLGVGRVGPSLGNFIALKRTWNVSLAALLYRMRSLNLISEWHYRTLCIEINKRGFHKKEPNGIERETSQILNKVFTALWSEKVTRADVARQLCMSQDDLDALVFKVMVADQTGEGIDVETPPGPRLRLI